jgi:hypothetical protein
MRYANDDLRLFMSRYTTHLQTCLRATHRQGTGHGGQVCEQRYAARMIS